MYYRILHAPPGFSDDCQFMVAAYTSTEFSSCIGNVFFHEQRFVPTVEDARALIPLPRTKLSFDPENQFLELWESETESPHIRRNNR